MKTKFHIILFAASAVFVSCDKTVPPPQAATPEPTPQLSPTPALTPTPTPTPVPTPEPTPVVRLAPDGKLFVVKNFSVSLEDGLHGFPIGREVTIISEDDSNYTVTDGKVTGSAPKTNFTNNLDVIEGLTAKLQSNYNAQQEAVRAARDQKNTQEQEFSSQRAVDQQKQYKDNLITQIGAAKAREAALWKILAPKYEYKGHNKSGWASADDKQRLDELGKVKERIKQLEAELRSFSPPAPNSAASPTPARDPAVARELEKLHQQIVGLMHRRDAIDKERKASIRRGNKASSPENQNRIEQIEALKFQISELKRKEAQIEQNGKR